MQGYIATSQNIFQNISIHHLLLVFTRQGEKEKRNSDVLDIKYIIKFCSIVLYSLIIFILLGLTYNVLSLRYMVCWFHVSIYCNIATVIVPNTSVRSHNYNCFLCS